MPTPDEIKRNIDEAHRLVGQFMAAWAFLETALNDFIRAALRLDFIQAAIITSNIQVRDKIFICRTAADIASESADWKERAHKTFIAISDLSADRNVVAHTMFGPNDFGGVSFLRVKAKGKLSWPTEEWSSALFALKVDDMMRLHREVSLMAGTFKRHEINLEELAKEIAENTPAYPRRGLLSAVARQRQAGQNSPSPNPEGSRESGPDPLEGVALKAPRPSRKPKQEKKPRKSAKKEAD